MTLSVKGLSVPNQAVRTVLGTTQWEPLRTSKHVKCTVLPWLHFGAHAGHKALGYASHKGP